MTIDVAWTHGAAHMRANDKVVVTEASEVVADIDAVWFDPDPHSKSGQSVRVTATATATADPHRDLGAPG